MKDKLGLIRIGTVTAVDPGTARVKALFEDLNSDDMEGGLVSDWLPVVQQGSTADQGYWLPQIGALVVCVMQSNALECGYVIGTVYNAEHTPDAPGTGVWYQRFADGTVIEYDPASGLKIDTPLNVTISGASVRLN